MNLFIAHFRSEAKWFYAGLASSFPNIESDDGNLLRTRPCGVGSGPGCKVFHISKTDASQGIEVVIEDDVPAPSGLGGQDLKDQVLVFKYKGKFHAVDHVSRSFNS